MKGTRRDFLRYAGSASLGLGFGVYVFPGIYQYASARTLAQEHGLNRKGKVSFKGFSVKEVTPNDEFYITSYSATIPDTDPARYRLRVEGLVEHPFSISLKELRTLQDKKEYVTLECIGNPVGGSSISNAFWEGVTLGKLIEKAGPKPGIFKAAFFAAEGYSDSIPYELALSKDVFLAYNMNGQPLPPEHGYPLRVVVPGIYGMKNVKWLNRIELVNYDFKGYWEKQGWSDSAVISVMSEILMPMENSRVSPGHYVIGGIAFGGRHGISRVQISIDDGAWQDAELKSPLARWAWRLWRYDWTPSRQGEYSIRVRAFDDTGKVQDSSSLLGSLFNSAFPDGARGIQTVKVTVGS